MDRFTRVLSSYEARFSRGPSDPRLHACTACRYLVESVDSHGMCDECEQARDARDEAEGAGAAVCPECDGYGEVRNWNLGPDSIDDLRTCPTCLGTSVRDGDGGEADLAADEGFNDWCADRQLAAVEAMAAEVDARDEALRARARAADAHLDDTDRNAGHRAAERYWSAREAAQLIARRAVSL